MTEFKLICMGTYSKIYCNRYLDKVIKVTNEKAAKRELAISKRLEDSGLDVSSLLIQKTGPGVMGTDFLIFSELCTMTLHSYMESVSYNDTNVECIYVGMQDGLAVLHSLNISHNDFSNLNVLLKLSHDGQIGVRICDFGSASCRDIGVMPPHITENGDVLTYPSTSRSNRAPELFGISHYDLRDGRDTAADVWALGRHLVDMLYTSADNIGKDRPMWDENSDSSSVNDDIVDPMDSTLSSTLRNRVKLVKYYSTSIARHWYSRIICSALQMINTRPRDATYLKQIFQDKNKLLTIDDRRGGHLAMDISQARLDGCKPTGLSELKELYNIAPQGINLYEFIKNNILRDRCEDTCWHIQRVTTDQANSKEWWDFHKGMVTGSKFASFSRDNTRDRVKRITKLFDQPVRTTVYKTLQKKYNALDFGSVHEDYLFNTLKYVVGIDINKVGFVCFCPCSVTGAANSDPELNPNPSADSRFTMIGASPDGIDSEWKTIYELKCPYSALGKWSGTTKPMNYMDLVGTHGVHTVYNAIDVNFNREVKFLALPHDLDIDTFCERLVRRRGMKVENEMIRETMAIVFASFIKLNMAQSSYKVYKINYDEDQSLERNTIELEARSSVVAEQLPQRKYYVCDEAKYQDEKQEDGRVIILNPLQRYTYQMVAELASAAKLAKRCPEEMRAMYCTGIFEEPPSEWMNSDLKIVSSLSNQTIGILAENISLTRYVICMNILFPSDMINYLFDRASREYLHDLLAYLADGDIKKHKFANKLVGQDGQFMPQGDKI